MKKLIHCNSCVCILFTVFVVLLGVRCSSKEAKTLDNNKYAKFFSGIGIIPPPPESIIVPTQGCGPCIKAAMDFLRDSVSSKNITVVITGPSVKSCLFLMKKFRVQREDVVFDSKTNAKRNNVLTIYPVLLSYANDKWHAVEITPGNYETTLTLNDEAIP